MAEMLRLESVTRMRYQMKDRSLLRHARTMGNWHVCRGLSNTWCTKQMKYDDEMSDPHGTEALGKTPA